jgi:hypothetical protein
LSAGIGWSGLSAGVKGEVNLIEVELPFKAKAMTASQAPIPLAMSAVLTVWP